ncbi:MAG: hypothetical protein IJZ44_00425 [Lachnospiraceae bacterium]|nr:hypothetical protein [Lachnospiraceae bacterium]
MRKQLLIACLLSCALLVGCGKDTSDEPIRDQGQAIGEETAAVGEEEADMIPTGEYYFVVDDVFSITGRGTVMAGYSMNAPIAVDTEVDLLSGSSRVNAVIKEIEDSNTREIVEELPADSLAGIVLDGFSRDQVERGDILVLRDGGKQGQRFVCEFETFYDPADPYASQLKDLAGKTVDISFHSMAENPYTATIDSIEIIEGIPAEGVIDNPIDKIVMTVSLNYDIFYVDYIKSFFDFTVVEDAEAGTTTNLHFDGVLYTAPEETTE